MSSTKIKNRRFGPKRTALGLLTAVLLVPGLAAPASATPDFDPLTLVQEQGLLQESDEATSAARAGLDPSEASEASEVSIAPITQADTTTD